MNQKELGPIAELLEEENKSLKDELLKMNSEVLHSKARMGSALNRSLGEWESHSRLLLYDEIDDKQHHFNLSLRNIKTDTGKLKTRWTTISRGSLLNGNANVAKNIRYSNDVDSPDKHPGLYTELLNIKEAHILNLQDELNKKTNQIEETKKQMRTTTAKLQTDIRQHSIENDKLREQQERLLKDKEVLALELDRAKDDINGLRHMFENYNKNMGVAIVKGLYDFVSIFIRSYKALALLLVLLLLMVFFN